MSILLIKDTSIIEGIIAFLFLPLFSYFFKHLHFKDRFYQSVLIISGTWTLTWFTRRIFVNLYIYYKNKYNWKNFNIII